MKIFCKQCGVHFPEDFQNTLKCRFWKDLGGEKLDEQHKKEIWDWLFSFNRDKFSIETNIAVNFNLQLQPVQGNDFAKIDGYVKMSEIDQRKFQKDWFKFFSTINEKQRAEIILRVFANSNPKWSKKLKK